MFTFVSADVADSSLNLYIFLSKLKSDILSLMCIDFIMDLRIVFLWLLQISVMMILISSSEVPLLSRSDTELTTNASSWFPDFVMEVPIGGSMRARSSGGSMRARSSGGRHLSGTNDSSGRHLSDDPQHQSNGAVPEGSKNGSMAHVSSGNSEVNYWQTDGVKEYQTSENVNHSTSGEILPDEVVSVQEHDRHSDLFAFTGDGSEWFHADGSNGSSSDSSSNKGWVPITNFESASLGVDHFHNKDHQSNSKHEDEETSVEIKEHDEFAPGVYSSSANEQWFGGLGDFHDSPPPSKSSSNNSSSNPSHSSDSGSGSGSANSWFGVNGNDNWKPVDTRSHRQQRKLNLDQDPSLMKDYDDVDIITAPPPPEVLSFVVGTSMTGKRRRTNLKAGRKVDTSSLEAAADNIDIVTAPPESPFLRDFKKNNQWEPLPPYHRKSVTSRTTSVTTSSSRSFSIKKHRIRPSGIPKFPNRIRPPMNTERFVKFISPPSNDSAAVQMSKTPEMINPSVTDYPNRSVTHPPFPYNVLRRISGDSGTRDVQNDTKPRNSGSSVVISVSVATEKMVPTQSTTEKALLHSGVQTTESYPTIVSFTTKLDKLPAAGSSPDSRHSVSNRTAIGMIENAHVDATPNFKPNSVPQTSTIDPPTSTAVPLTTSSSSRFLETVSPFSETTPKSTPAAPTVEITSTSFAWPRATSSHSWFQRKFPFNGHEEVWTSEKDVKEENEPFHTELPSSTQNVPSSTALPQPTTTSDDELNNTVSDQQDSSSSDNVSYVLIGAFCGLCVICIVAVVAMFHYRQAQQRHRRLLRSLSHASIHSPPTVPLYANSLKPHTHLHHTNPGLEESSANYERDNGVEAATVRQSKIPNSPNLWFMTRRDSPYSLCDQHVNYHGDLGWHHDSMTSRNSNVFGSDSQQQRFCTEISNRSTSDKEQPCSLGDGRVPGRNSFHSPPSTPVYRSGFNRMTNLPHSSGLEYMNKGEMIYWSSNSEQLI